jgi:uncharacterized protein YndB with AHSA1/START domain
VRYEQSIVVNAPADKVFAYVSDITKLSEWGGFGNVVRPTSHGEVAVGSTYECDGKQFGKHTDNVTVTEYVPNKRFVSETKGDTGHSRNTFELEEQGGATKVTKVLEFVKPALTTRLAGPVLKKMAPTNLAKDLERIKARIEGTA